MHLTDTEIASLITIVVSVGTALAAYLKARTTSKQVVTLNSKTNDHIISYHPPQPQWKPKAPGQ